jgi:hypothetical protein
MLLHVARQKTMTTSQDLNKERAVANLEKFVLSSFPQTRKEVKGTTNEYEWQETSRGKVI